MPRPIEDASGAERWGPGVAVEGALATDPVEGQCPSESPLLIAAGVAKMPEPGEGMQIVEPIVVVDLDGKGRDPVRIDELAGEQVSPLHHFEDGLAVRGAEFDEGSDELVARGAGPGPADEGICDDVVGHRKQRSARKETHRMCQSRPLAARPCRSDRTRSGLCQDMG